MTPPTLLLAGLPAAYILRKVAIGALQPLGIALFLLLLAFIFRRRLLIAVAALVVYAASIPPVSMALFSFWEGQYPRLRVGECPPAGAVVVLGGLLRDYDGPERIEWSEAVERFDMGLRLYLANRAPRLILGGGRLQNRKDGLTEGDAMRAAALARGAHPDGIRVIGEALVTADEARRVRALGLAEGFSKVILVTSAFHLPRAVLLFEREGLEVIPFPVDYQLAKDAPFTLMDLSPRAGALALTEAALQEFYGTVYYRYVAPLARSIGLRGSAPHPPDRVPRPLTAGGS